MLTDEVQLLVKDRQRRAGDLEISKDSRRHGEISIYGKTDASRRGLMVIGIAAVC